MISTINTKRPVFFNRLKLLKGLLLSLEFIIKFFIFIFVKRTGSKVEIVVMVSTRVFTCFELGLYYKGKKRIGNFVNEDGSFAIYILVD